MRRTDVETNCSFQIIGSAQFLFVSRSFAVDSTIILFLFWSINIWFSSGFYVWSNRNSESADKSTTKWNQRQHKIEQERCENARITKEYSRKEQNRRRKMLALKQFKLNWQAKQTENREFTSLILPLSTWWDTGHWASECLSLIRIAFEGKWKQNEQSPHTLKWTYRTIHFVVRKFTFRESILFFFFLIFFSLSSFNFKIVDKAMPEMNKKKKIKNSKRTISFEK